MEAGVRLEGRRAFILDPDLAARSVHLLRFDIREWPYKRREYDTAIEVRKVS